MFDLFKVFNFNVYASLFWCICSNTLVWITECETKNVNEPYVNLLRKVIFFIAQASYLCVSLYANTWFLCKALATVYIFSYQIQLNALIRGKTITLTDSILKISIIIYIYGLNIYLIQLYLKWLLYDYVIYIMPIQIYLKRIKDISRSN